MKTFIAIALVLLSSPASAGELDAAFTIVRKGSQIGYHAVRVDVDGDAMRIETRIRMRVKFGPLVLYHYDLSSSEIWRDGALYSLDSRTDRNGKDMTLAVRRDGDELVVDGSSYAGPAPLHVMPGAYWNKAIVDASMLLNTQNGALIPVVVENVGRSPTPAGAVGEHYRVRGSVTLDLWYDGAQWTGAEFVIDGEELSYALMPKKLRDDLFADIGFSGDGSNSAE